MVQCAREYPEFAIGQQLVAQIPWGHNILDFTDQRCCVTAQKRVYSSLRLAGVTEDDEIIE